MPANKSPAAIIPIDRVQQHILLLRGQRVILAADLAALYGVTTKRLNQQVNRNAHRFPDDFMFQLTWEEAAASRLQIATLVPPGKSGLRSHTATLNKGKNMKYRPFAFTEHGAIMAATVLNSPLAVDASLFVVRAFVQLRQLLSTHHELAAKLGELESKLQNHDDQIVSIINAINQLMEEPEDPPKPPIGFHTEVSQPKSARARRKLPAPSHHKP